MSTCHFCGADNEDWMKICQECGNPVIDNTKNEKSDEESNLSYDDDEPKKKNNMDLIIALAVLSVILVALLVYVFLVVL